MLDSLATVAAAATSPPRPIVLPPLSGGQGPGARPLGNLRSPDRAMCVAHLSDLRVVPWIGWPPHHRTMGRQRMATNGDLESASVERDQTDPTHEAVLLAATRIPGELAEGLARVDPVSRARAIQRLQAGVGNGAMGGLLAPRGPVPANAVVQRDGEDPDIGGAIPLDATGAGG